MAPDCKILTEIFFYTESLKICDGYIVAFMVTSCNICVLMRNLRLVVPFTFYDHPA